MISCPVEEGNDLPQAADSLLSEFWAAFSAALLAPLALHLLVAERGSSQ